MGRKNEYTVVDMKKESSDTVTLSLKGEKISFKAGQYVAAYLNDNQTSHGKFYTISSSPSEAGISLSIKKVGKFSTALYDLQKGEKVFLSGPYGWFFPKEGADNLVFLAAGIGITPFLSILRDYGEKRIKKNITLFYTNKCEEEVCFRDELDRLASKRMLTIYHYFTLNQPRLDAGFVAKKIKSLSGKNFYICGPMSFVIDMRKQLLAFGVEEENIFTESFF